MGEAICRALAAGGDRVVVADVKEKEARRVAEEIDGSFMYCDITVADDVEQLIEGVAETLGSVDVVVANAGLAPAPMAVHTIEDYDWHQMMMVNGFGTFLTVKHALRQMLRQKNGGVILGMGSVTGMLGHSGTASYNFTKAGIISLTKTVAIEYAKRNIRMNCLCPSTTGTDKVRDFVMQLPPEIQGDLLNLNPVPGLVQPSDVGQAAAMLCAPSPYLTGVVLPIDGGFTSCAPTYTRTDYVAVSEEQELKAARNFR